MAVRGNVWLIGGAIAIAAAAGYFIWKSADNGALPPGIATGNGRIEAVEIDIAAKTAGRLRSISVIEGELVKAGQVLAQLDTVQLVAKKREAEAQLRRTEIAVGTAGSVVTQREAEHASAQAQVEQRQIEVEAAQRNLARAEQLFRGNTVSEQVLDDNKVAERKAHAALAAARASLAAAQAGIGAARAQVVDAEASVEAAKAAIESLDADIADSTLTAPRDGRIQYLVAQPGEVLAGGGRVINMVDVSDVYMTFFLPTEDVGRLRLGADARLVMDAAPQIAIPARISFVADVAQFTPKTVETEEERLKLMFRVRARIEPALLQKHIEHVKTGLPGRAYVQVVSDAAWPAFLETNLVR